VSYFQSVNSSSDLRFRAPVSTSDSKLRTSGNTESQLRGSNSGTLNNSPSDLKNSQNASSSSPRAGVPSTITPPRPIASLPSPGQGPGQEQVQEKIPGQGPAQQNTQPIEIPSPQQGPATPEGPTQDRTTQQVGCHSAPTLGLPSLPLPPLPQQGGRGASRPPKPEIQEVQQESPPKEKQSSKKVRSYIYRISFVCSKRTKRDKNAPRLVSLNFFRRPQKQCK
jgi:hypothetical protein